MCEEFGRRCSSSSWSSICKMILAINVLNYNFIFIFFPLCMQQLLMCSTTGHNYHVLWLTYSHCMHPSLPFSLFLPLSKNYCDNRSLELGFHGNVEGIFWTQPTHHCDDWESIQYHHCSHFEGHSRGFLSGIQDIVYY